MCTSIAALVEELLGDRAIPRILSGVAWFTSTEADSECWSLKHEGATRNEGDVRIGQWRGRNKQWKRSEWVSKCVVCCISCQDGFWWALIIQEQDKTCNRTGLTLDDDARVLLRNKRRGILVLEWSLYMYEDGTMEPLM